MASWSSELKRLEAQQRRVEREEKKRQKDLLRRLKEEERLSELERARLEVDAYQGELDVLLSVHKEQNPPIEWRKFADSLPPHLPVRAATREFGAILIEDTHEVFGNAPGDSTIFEVARNQDQADYEAIKAQHETELKNWRRIRDLARGVLAGDACAYTQAVSEFPNLAEISNLGTDLHMTVHTPKLVECVLKVMGKDRIPAEIKTLTAAGKLSVKPMPKGRFHEIYQDYVSGCLLRLARELFALLPVHTLLLTATVEGLDTKTGNETDIPVISIVVPRAVLEKLNFENLDPTVAMGNFQRRGDAMASKKSDTFTPIQPLGPEDIIQTQNKSATLPELLGMCRQLRTDLSRMAKSFAASLPDSEPILD